MSLVHALPAGPLDVIGDVHGERQALEQLVKHLGYDDSGRHPAGRKLVFVGDFCDRGPDSPAVLKLVAQTAAAGIEAGRPVGVCGESASDPGAPPAPRDAPPGPPPAADGTEGDREDLPF